MSRQQARGSRLLFLPLCEIKGLVSQPFDFPVGFFVTFKTLLPLRGTGVSKVAALRHTYTGKPMYAFLQDPDILNHILPFLTSPAVKDTLRAYRPMSLKCSLNSVDIRYAVPEKSACKWNRVRSAETPFVTKQVRKTTAFSC